MKHMTIEIPDMVCLRAAIDLRFRGLRPTLSPDPLYIEVNGLRLLAAAHGLDLIDRALMRALRGAR